MKNRVGYIDLLRIISITLVMFNHTGNLGYMYFTECAQSPFYFAYMFFSICVKIAVPVFFMISGALLLHKEETVLQVIKKRSSRVIIVLLIASVFYYVVFSKNVTVIGFFKTIYQSSATTSLWFLYSYLGMLLMLPMLQKLAKTMTNAEFLYMIFGYIVLSGIIPALEFVFSEGTVTLNPRFSAVLFTASNIVYAMTGYFLERRLSENVFRKKNMVILSMIAIAAIALTCVLTQLQIMREGVLSLNDVEKYFNLFTIIPAFSLFFVIKGLFLKIHIPPRLNKIITTLGESVFGAYLIEKLVRSVTKPIATFLSSYINYFLAAVIWVIIGTSISLLFITFLKKCPYISKVVNQLI